MFDILALSLKYILCYFCSGLQVSVVGLERALHQYINNDSLETAFDMKTVPLETQPLVEQRTGKYFTLILSLSSPELRL